MQKRLLVAVDGSELANNALAYAAGFASAGSEVHVALMHVQPVTSNYFVEEAKSDPKIEEALQRVLAENRAISHDLLQKGKELLTGRGVAETAIELVSQTRILGMTRDLIKFGRTHRFDAIVAGRRGLSRIQKLFMGSTSAKLIEHSGDMPVWIVDGKVHPRQILVATDIHPDGPPIVDQAIRMFSGMSATHLTFFHVVEKMRSRLRLDEAAGAMAGFELIEELAERQEKKALDAFWKETTRRLTEAGFTESQFSLKTPPRTGKTAKMIIEEADQNNHDTVIIGRTGSNKAFYFGNVARYVSERLTEHALWVIG